MTITRTINAAVWTAFLLISIWRACVLVGGGPNWDLVLWLAAVQAFRMAAARELEAPDA